MNYQENYEYWKNNVEEKYQAEMISIGGDEKETKERFTLPLAFGTAGMRGTIGMGISNMNVYTVARASFGLAKYILSLGKKQAEMGVIVSYDTRRMSFEFALTTARVLAKCGVKVRLFENVRPVPMCSFAVRHLGCIAGVMITASHNPKEYNGYKVYGDDGAQMSPEATKKVVEYIDQADYFGIDLQDVKTTNHDDIKGKDNYELGENITVVGASVDNAYYDTIEKLGLSPDSVKRVGKDIKIVYSPIHGSGWIPVTTILARMGIEVNVVEEQKYPDTEFRTVSVPNPEQSEALSMGIKLADKLGSDIVIGTDPDCDRMGVAVRDDQGKFVLLNGNQIGAMLMNYILSRREEEGTMPSNPAVVKTIVTTSLADRIARSFGVRVYDVLTGFKFIGEKIKEWETSGESTFLFGYEESYGYLSGTHARDKDAVVASMLFAEMVCYYTDKGVKVYDKLIELFEKYGYFVENSKSIFFKGLDGMQKMTDIMTMFRQSQLKEIAGSKVVSKTDLNVSKKYNFDGTVDDVDLPKTNVVKWDLGNDEWACVRPSGTEPKLKIYVSTNADDKQTASEKNQKIMTAISEMI
ncbi:MAG: phospho-sugar mutase [Clostridia bacterium]|nr:phospho-sugar mutase [Clostridia bacterium]MDY4082775.1 phospho-sugar mutase [Eubacteriales bacterium]